MEVPAQGVINAYKQQLAEANHTIAILTAQVELLRSQGEISDVRPAGREVHGSGSQTPE